MQQIQALEALFFIDYCLSLILCSIWAKPCVVLAARWTKADATFQSRVALQAPRIMCCMPDTSSSPSFLGQIRQHLDALPPSERRLAAFMLDFPGDLASYNASELAALVHVSNATVTRLTQRLGYASYEEARRHARQESTKGSPLFVAQGTQAASTDFMAQHLQRAQENLLATFAQIDGAVIDSIAQAMCAAQQVTCLGYRNNRHFAAYLRWQLAQLLPGTRVIPGAGETLAEYAVDMQAGHLLIVFALRRASLLTTSFVREATRAGAQVVYVTDQLSSTADIQAQWVLRCHSAAPGPLDNHVAATMLCDLLATRAMHFAGAKSRHRLSQVEAAHEAFTEILR